MGIPRQLPPDRVPVEERGGRRYQIGTLYYSKRNNAFLEAGREGQGPVPTDAVSGRIRWRQRADLGFNLRDETGQFISSQAPFTSAGTQFGRREFLVETKDITGFEKQTQVGPDSQIVERFYILGDDNRIYIEEVYHGVGNEFSIQRTGKQFFRNVGGRVGAFPGQMTSPELRRFIMRTEVVLETAIA
ncbi:MAG: hypothetical protein GY767_14040 [Shimia sp.]|nr:hypothetical protein [Shimia sp.]